MVVALLISFYLTGMRIPCSTAKIAAGIYDADKFTPIIQSVVNLVVSIVLVKKIGLLGVIIGTIVSSLVLPSWQRPYLVYKYVLHRSSKEYYVRQAKNIGILFVTSMLTFIIFKYVVVSKLLFRIIIKIAVTIIIFVSLIIVVHKDTTEYKYALDMLKKILRRVKRNEKEIN